jgi:hypothetical protein
MIKEERELSIIYLKGIMEKYVESERGIRSPLPEYYAIECAIRALEQETPLDKIKAEIMKLQTYKLFEGEKDVYVERDDVLKIIDKYKAESEEEE